MSLVRRPTSIWSVAKPLRPRLPRYGQIPLCRLPRDVRDKASYSPNSMTPTSPKLPWTRHGTWAKGDVTALSRTCLGRHGEVGVVEFGH